jgi:hypothetical protein
MTRRLTLSAAILAVILCTAYRTVAQQPLERLVKRLPVEEDEPIEIADIKVDGQSVSLDKRFRADDDWLGTLVFSVKNKSNKLILFASIRLQFPRPDGSREIPSIYDMSYGNPVLQTRRTTPQDTLLGISPGETAEIRLSAQQFAALREFLSATKFPSSIENVELSISRIIFADDTMWYAGAISVRDPKDPSTWTNSKYANSKP